MKKLLQAVVAAALVSSVAPAFAQSVVSQAQGPVAATQPAVTTSSAWNSNPGRGKTREQVYEELVHAEQDGQLAHLNRTIYAHH